MIRRLSAPRSVRALLVLTVAGVAACSPSAATGSATPPAATAATIASATATATAAAPSVPAADSPAPSAEASEVAGATAVPTNINPCELVTPAEASALTGATFTSGKRSTTDNNGQLCSYGQEGFVLQVLVVVAPDAATAKAQEPAFKAELEKGASQAGVSDLKLTEMPEFQPGVDAAVVSGSASGGGITVKAIALWALKGAVLVATSDVAIGGSVPTSDAMQAQAKVTLGRLP